MIKKFILVLLLINCCTAMDYAPETTFTGNVSYLDSGSTSRTFDMYNVPTSADGMVYNSTTSFWELLSLKYLNSDIIVGPESDGAKSILYDYTTDGIDDQVQFNSAITEGDTDGRDVHILKGNYYTNAAIDFPTTGRFRGMHLRGSGTETIIFADGDINIIDMSGDSSGYQNVVTQCHVSDMALIGTNYSQGIGIYFNNTIFCTIENMKIQNVSYCLYDDPSYYNTYFITVKNCMLGSWGSGYEIGSACVYGDWGDCVFEEVGCYTDHHDFYFTEFSQGNTIQNCELSAGAGYHQIYDGGYNNVWMNNYIEGPGTVLFDGGYSPIFQHNKCSVSVDVSNTTQQAKIYKGLQTTPIRSSSPTTTIYPVTEYRQCAEEKGRDYETHSYITDHTLVGDAGAYGGYCYDLGDNEQVTFLTKYLPNVLCQGQYEISYRLKANASFSNDAMFDMWNNDDSVYILSTTYATPTTSWDWYGPYEFNVSASDCDGSGNSILIRCKNIATNPSELYIDMIKIERIGLDGT